MTERTHSHLRAAGVPDRSRADEVFTPASPVTRRELFAGRAMALQQLLDLVEQPGRHAVIFGERGTGKTSLATIVPEMHAGPLGRVRVVATDEDTFESLWQRAADAVRLVLRRAERGLTSAPFGADAGTAIAKGGPAGEAEALALLARLTATAPAWIVFDDFDRVTDPAVRSRMRTLAEATAAAAPGATLVFAGTAVSGDGLLDSSLALVPVQAGRFGAEEAIECVLRALRLASLTADDAVVERIVTLANGVPGSAQALGHAAALAAVADGTAHLTTAHLDAGVAEALAVADPVLTTAYEQAIVRARRGIYPEILLGCALAPRDAYGTFNVAGVGEAVTRIVRREVRGLTNQVSALTEEGRGAVLVKTGAASAARYRFVDPRLEPYILMRGLAEGWATHQAPAWLPGLPESGPDSRAA